MKTRAAELQKELAAADPDALGRAVTVEGLRRIGKFLTGVENYRRHHWRRDIVDPPAVWKEGSSALLDYGGVGPPVLFVPSLINKAYILDLSEQHSLLRWLAGKGINPWLLDWGYPGELERGFTLDDYIAGRLVHAFDAVEELTGAPVTVTGYCMGGLLALGLAQLRASRMNGLALLATPWNFHANDGGRAQALAATLPLLEPQLCLFGALPVDTLQMLFAGLDPLAIQRKFEAFAELKPDSARAALFVALEDWLNDGVPLAAPVARECIQAWYGENRPLRGKWAVAGRPVRADRLDIPALVLIPGRDRIVPPESATALAEAIPSCQPVTVEAGHIGMVVGSGMKTAVWNRIRKWVAAVQK